MDKKKLLLSLALLAAVGGLYWFYSAADKKVTKLPAAQKEDHSHDHSHGEEDHDHAHEEGNIELTNQQQKTFGIQIQKAGPGSLSISLSSRGKIILHPDRLVHVLPKISGVAMEARKRIGDSVKQGEVIAVLESREMADIKAAYLAAIEKEKLANTLLQREEKLFQNRISAEQDLINAKSNYQETKISIQLARQKLRAFGLADSEIEDIVNQKDPDLRIFEIRSPMDGVVITRHITKGEFIDSSSTIYEIADLSDLLIEIGVYPKDLYKISEGQNITVSLPEEKLSSEAKIIYVSPIIQDETITSKAIAELNNKDRKWLPGTFVKVDISTEKASLPIVISKEAVQNIDGKDVVFVKTSEGFEKRPIQIGRSDDSNIEVLSGLREGEAYASSKTFLLKAELGKSEAEHEH